MGAFHPYDLIINPQKEGQACNELPAKIIIYTNIELRIVRAWRLIER